MSNDPPHTFTSSRGVTVALKPMAGELDRLLAFRAQHQIAPPTYTVHTAGGVDEVHPHAPPPLDTPDAQKHWEAYLHGDATIAYTPAQTSILTEADRAVWNDYIAREAAATNEWGTIALKSVLLNGIAPSAEQIAVWVKRCAFIGTAVPDDPVERQYTWAMAELIGTAQDATDLLAATLAANTVPEEMISAKLDSFRDRVARRNAADETAAPGPEALLDVRAGVRKGASGALSRAERKRVRRPAAPG